MALAAYLRAGSDFICTYRYRQPLYGTEQYHYGIVNTDGTTITPGGREFEQFIKEVKQLRTQAKARDVKPADLTSPSHRHSFQP